MSKPQLQNICLGCFLIIFLRAFCLFIGQVEKIQESTRQRQGSRIGKGCSSQDSNLCLAVSALHYMQAHKPQGHLHRLLGLFDKIVLARIIDLKMFFSKNLFTFGFNARLQLKTNIRGVTRSLVEVKSCVVISVCSTTRSPGGAYICTFVTVKRSVFLYGMTKLTKL